MLTSCSKSDLRSDFKEKFYCKVDGRVCLPVLENISTPNHTTSEGRHVKCQKWSEKQVANGVWDKPKPCGSYTGNISCPTKVACSESSSQRKQN